MSANLENSAVATGLVKVSFHSNPKKAMLKNCFFSFVVWEKTLGSPFDCKEIKPINSKEVNPEYSLEGLMLKLQYFWPPDEKI